MCNNRGKNFYTFLHYTLVDGFILYSFVDRIQLTHRGKALCVKNFVSEWEREGWEELEGDLAPPTHWWRKIQIHI